MSKRKAASVLVCVTNPESSEKLIRLGKKLALEMGLSLQLLNVQPSANGYCARGREIEQFYQISKDANAEMTIMFDDAPAAAAAKFARKAGAKHIVTGLSGSEDNEFADVIHSLVPSMPISMVSGSGKIFHKFPSYPRGLLQAKAMG